MVEQSDNKQDLPIAMKVAISLIGLILVASVLGIIVSLARFAIVTIWRWV